MKCFAILFFLLILSTNVVYTQWMQQGNKLVGTGGVSQGHSISVSSDGNTAILGGPFDGNNFGAAWVFARTSGVWSQQGPKLVGTGADTGIVGVEQGTSVAVSGNGNTAILGGWLDNNGTGAAWVFTRSSGTWSQQGSKLLATNAIGASYLGSSVSLSADGSLALVGGCFDNNRLGAAFVFRRIGGVWSQGAKLIGSGALGIADQGWSVSLSADGNTALVGGPSDNNENGAAWVFFRSGGLWSQQGPKLVGTGGGNSRQGWSVSLSRDGNTAIIGGISDNNGVGAAWVFTRSGGVWTQQGNKLVGVGSVGNAGQGSSVALDSLGNTAAIGGPTDALTGAVWTFARTDSVWSQLGGKLIGLGANGNSGHGSSVSFSADGKTLIEGGPSDNPAGAAWVFTRSPLSFISPVFREVLRADSRYDIQWLAPGLDSIQLELSLDSGKTLFGGGIFPNTGSWNWHVTDTLSSKCMWKISDPDNPSDSAWGPLFRIKPYVLTRFKANTDYERFTPLRHGWQFGNQRNLLWPQSWWSQFDYRFGTDPYTGSEYPVEFILSGVEADTSDFIDWPLFVHRFGIQQCYWNTATPGVEAYRESGLYFWGRHKQKWRGSCSGFAVSSLLAFSFPEAFRDSFPSVGNFEFLNQVDINNETRKVINELFFDWNGSNHGAYALQARTHSPRETLDELKDLLLSDIEEPRYLVIVDSSKPRAHAIVPYYMFQGKDEAYYVYTYDSRHPNDSTFLRIDSVNNSWFYPSLNWADTKGCYLMDPISRYLSRPLIPPGTHHTDYQDVPTVNIYVQPLAATLIRSSNGEMIGFADSSLIEEMPDASALISPTSEYFPPIGYLVPPDTYTITLDRFQDSRAYVALVTDSITYQYSRSNALFGESDNVMLSNALSVTNNDAVSKPLNLHTNIISDTAEMTFDLSGLSLFAQDSVTVKGLSQRNLLVKKVGRGAMYDLTLLFGSSARSGKFVHNDIVLDSNTTHRILPLWNTINTSPVKILVDHGNNGTIDDSIIVTNQTTDAPSDPEEGIPTTFLLHQNYPNPFNPSTMISYQLAAETHVTLKIYDLLGQVVATLVDEVQHAGYKRIEWNAGNVAAGTYFLRLNAGSFTQVRKMMLLK